MSSLCNEWRDCFQRLVIVIDHSSKEIKEVFIDWMNELNNSKPNYSLSINMAYIEKIEQAPSTKEELLNLSFAMKQVLIQCVANRKGFAENFNNMANNLERSIKSLKEAFDYFQEN